MRHLDPVTLRLFVAACEERNIARAAAREALVPSAVSKRIAAVEAAIGSPLLVRGRRGIEPTAAGEVLLRQAREVLWALERTQAELTGFAAGVQGSVRVLASVSALAEQLPDDIAAFLGRHDKVRVTLDERVSSEIVRGIREGSADLGVLWDASDTGGLLAVPYRGDRLCVVLHPSHALARRRRLHFEQTLAHPAVGVAPGGMMDMLLRREAARLGVAPAYRIQIASFDSACRVVAAGLGLAILPREATATFARAAGLAMVPLADAWSERRFVVVARGEATLSAAARQLMEHLQRRAAAAR
ncbi:MAG: LysR family transcriptional regulator [Rubrivivax sp.]|nr:LysR family transcriptional regulator [Rubrivivax sp.]